MPRWWKWRPHTYPQVMLLAVLYAAVFTLIWWALRGEAAQAAVAGTVCFVVTGALQAMRLWDRRSNE